jgi:LuxR family transcriptional regulator, maltose regulon positive regulatory protein
VPVAAQKPGSLLRGKVTPPERGAGLLAREKLLVNLHSLARQKLLVTLVAPAGYGKTVLLGALYDRLTESGKTAYWYNCDRTDVVPQRLASFLKGIGNLQIESDQTISFRSGSAEDAHAIMAGLEQRNEPVTIILENYHLAQSNETDALIEALLAVASPNLHLVISSRAKPAFASRRLFLNGQIAELRVSDLTFSPDEISELAHKALPYFGDNDLGAVWRKTEGWPLAVRLTCIALQKARNPKHVMEEIEAREADVAEYLAEEVLRAQPEAIRHFLIATSILEQFNAPLSQAMLPDSDGATMIALIEREDLFISKVETGSGWFRFHPLFRHYLLSQFAHLPKTEQSRLRHVAMRWYDEQGYTAQAIDMALLSGEADHAHRLLVQLAPELVSIKGDLATFLQLLGRFPRELVDGDLSLIYWEAWAMLFSRRYAEAAKLVGYLHRSLDSEGGAQLDPGIRARLGLLDTLAATFTDDMATARRAGNEWLVASQTAEPVDRATAAYCLVLANLALHDLREARRALEVAQRSISGADSIYGEAWVCGVGMAIDLISGEPGLAIARAQALSDRLEDRSKAPFNILSTIALMAAAAHYHRNDVAVAERMLGGSLPMLTEHGSSETATFGLSACLRLTASQKGATEALFMARKLEPGLTRAYAPRLELALSYERALLLFRADRIDEALEEAASIAEVQSLGEARSDGGEPELPCVRELRQLIAARSAIADKTWNEALRILAIVATNARHDGRMHRLVQALILKAAVHIGQSDPRRASRTFLEAVDLAAPRGLLRVFLDDASLCRPLLAATMSAQEQAGGAQAQHQEFLAAMQEGLGVKASAVGEELSAPLEPLTARELSILKMLVSGMRNRQIAAHFSMSEATVKWHLYNLYSKLGVNNRTAAIHRCHVMGLANT